MSNTLETRQQQQHYDLYHFDPSFAAPIVFAAAFCIFTIVLLIRMIQHKIRFLIAFILGAILEVIGYVARAYSAHETPNWTLGPYIVQSLALLLPPVFFAASIYMSLSRLIIKTQREDLSIIKPKLVTILFVMGDVISFLTQSYGGGMQASKDPQKIKAGAWIVVGGLVIQLVYFGFFIVVAFNFHLRARRAVLAEEVKQEISWKKNMPVLYTGSFLILIRSIYRTIEFADGSNGYLMNHEAFFYVFDAALMTILVAIYAIFTPYEISGIRRQRQAEQKLEAGYASSEPPQ